MKLSIIKKMAFALAGFTAMASAGTWTIANEGDLAAEIKKNYKGYPLVADSGYAFKVQGQTLSFVEGEDCHSEYTRYYVLGTYHGETRLMYSGKKLASGDSVSGNWCYALTPESADLRCGTGLSEYRLSSVRVEKNGECGTVTLTESQFQELLSSQVFNYYKAHVAMDSAYYETSDVKKHYKVQLAPKDGPFAKKNRAHGTIGMYHMDVYRPIFSEISYIRAIGEETYPSAGFSIPSDQSYDRTLLGKLNRFVNITDFKDPLTITCGSVYGGGGQYDAIWPTILGTYRYCTAENSCSYGKYEEHERSVGWQADYTDEGNYKHSGKISTDIPIPDFGENKSSVQYIDFQTEYRSGFSYAYDYHGHHIRMTDTNYVSQNQRVYLMHELNIHPAYNFTLKKGNSNSGYFVKYDDHITYYLNGAYRVNDSISDFFLLDEKKSMTLKAVANEEDGYVFKGWYSNSKLVSSDPILHLVFIRDTSLTPYFEKGEFVTIKAAVQGNGKVNYKYRDEISESGNGVSVNPDYDEWVSLIAHPDNGYRFAGWYSGNKLYSNQNVLSITGADFLDTKDLTAKFVSETSKGTTLSAYVYKFRDKTYGVSNAPVSMPFNNGEDSVIVSVNAVSTELLSYKRYIYYQVKVGDGEWGPVDEDGYPVNRLSSTAYIASDNSYKYSINYKLPASVLTSAGAKSVQLRFAMYGSSRGEYSDVVYSAPIVFLVQHKVTVECYNGAYKTDCNKARVTFVDGSGAPLPFVRQDDDVSSKIWRWFYYGDVVRVSAMPRYDYAFNEWIEQNKLGTALSRWNTENFETTIDGEKWYRANFDDRTIETTIVQESSLESGASKPAFYAKGDQNLVGYTLQKVGGTDFAPTYEDVNVDAADFALAPGKYRVVFALGFKREGDKKLAASCQQYVCDGYSVVNYEGIFGNQNNLIRAYDLPMFTETDNVIHYYYDFTVEGDFMVIFNVRGEAAPEGVASAETLTVKFGEKVSEKMLENKEGIRYMGWRDWSDGGYYDFNKPVTSNLSLIMAWIKTYKVTFFDDEGKKLEEQIVESAHSAISPKEPTKREGSSFDGWFLMDDDVAYDFSTEVYENLDLYEKWIINKYEIAVAANDSKMGSVKGAGEYEYGTEVELVATAAEGYKFSNWKDDAKAAATRKVVVKGDAEYTAVFEKLPASSSSVKPNSSSGKTEAFVAFAAAVPQFSLSVAGRNVQIAGARVGSAYAVLDMQGRVLATGRTASASMEIAVPRAGSYMVRVGSQTKRVNVK